MTRLFVQQLIQGNNKENKAMLWQVDFPHMGAIMHEVDMIPYHDVILVQILDQS